MIDLPVLKTQFSDIKFIYSYLHVFRLVDMIAVLGLCSRDIDLR